MWLLFYSVDRFIVVTISSWQNLKWTHREESQWPKVTYLGRFVRHNFLDLVWIWTCIPSNEKQELNTMLLSRFVQVNRWSKVENKVSSAISKLIDTQSRLPIQMIRTKRCWARVLANILGIRRSHYLWIPLAFNMWVSGSRMLIWI